MNDLEMFAGLESTAHFAWIESSVSTCSLLFFFKIGRSTPRSAAADTCEETDCILKGIHHGKRNKDAMISITAQSSSKVLYRAKVSLQYIKKQLPTAPCKVSSLLFPI